MTDKSQLLEQLRIDRSAEPRRSFPPWTIGALLLLLLLAAGGLYAMLRQGKPEVRVAEVIALRGATAPAAVLDASGYVVARRQATVSSKITGKVTEILIEEGQQVREGQVLARLDDSNARAQYALAESQLEASRARLAEVRVQQAEAERQLRRTRELAEKGLVSQSALDAAQANVDVLRAQLESAERNATVAQRSLDVQRRLLEDTVVRAPFEGVITVKNAQEGEMISPLSAGGAGTRTGIGTLVDMNSLEIEVDVNENFINRVRAGQPVAATLNAYPDWRIPGSVIAVIPAADRSKATVKVRVAIGARDERILPDMGVRVAFLEAPLAEDSSAAMAGVTVPKAALREEGAEAIVFVLQGDRLERRAVRLGPMQGDQATVLAGLRAGERVVVGKLEDLRDGLQVRVLGEAAP